MAYPLSKITQLLADSYVEQEQHQAGFQVKLMDENSKIKRTIIKLLNQLSSIEGFPTELIHQLQEVSSHRNGNSQLIQLYRKINHALLDIARKRLSQK